MHGGREPVFEVGVEAVLRLARLQIEEAQDQRAGKAEQRGRERDAHAAERRGEPLAQGFENRSRIASGLQRFHHLADRADGLDQAPEGAEQAEEDQQAGQIARQVAGLVESRCDRIQDAAHHLGRDRHAAEPVAEQRRHRRQQDRRPLDRDAGIGQPEAVDPGDFGEQPQHLPERQQDADHQHAEDQAVQARIGHEGAENLPVQHHADQAAEHQKYQHPHKKNARRGELVGIEFASHRWQAFQ